jgi:hypothetical protein
VIPYLIQALLLLLVVLLEELLPLVLLFRGPLLVLVELGDDFLEGAAYRRDHLDVFLGKRGYVVLGVSVEEACAILCAGLAGVAPDAIRDDLVSLPHMVFLSHLELKLEMRGRRERPVDGGINSLDRTLCVQEVPPG